MGELFLIATASLVLGMRHATDPDHILAVATIVGREQSLRGAARIGVIWGLGHGITIALLGGGVIAFRFALSPRLELSLEFGVALMLMLLGTLALLRRRSTPQPTPLRPLLVGFIHGLAGSAAASVLVLSTMGDPRWGIAYLIVFGMGTLLGMALMTSVLAAPSLLALRRSPDVAPWIRATTGALTLALGCYLAFRIGILDGLLLGSPNAVSH